MLEHFLLHIFNVLVLYHILNCGGVFSIKFSPPINFVHPWFFCMNTSVIDAWANNTKKIIYWETQNNTNNPLCYGGIIKSNTNKFNKHMPVLVAFIWECNNSQIKMSLGLWDNNSLVCFVLLVSLFFCCYYYYLRRRKKHVGPTSIILLMKLKILYTNF